MFEVWTSAPFTMCDELVRHMRCLTLLCITNGFDRRTQFTEMDYQRLHERHLRIFDVVPGDSIGDGEDDGDGSDSDSDDDSNIVEARGNVLEDMEFIQWHIGRLLIVHCITFDEMSGVIIDDDSDNKAAFEFGQLSDFAQHHGNVFMGWYKVMAEKNRPMFCRSACIAARPAATTVAARPAAATTVAALPIVAVARITYQPQHTVQPVIATSHAPNVCTVFSENTLLTNFIDRIDMDLYARMRRQIRQEDTILFYRNGKLSDRYGIITNGGKTLVDDTTIDTHSCIDIDAASAELHGKLNIDVPTDIVYNEEEKPLCRKLPTRISGCGVIEYYSNGVLDRKDRDHTGYMLPAKITADCLEWWIDGRFLRRCQAV